MADRQRTLERSASVLDRGARFSFTDRSGTSNANDHSESRKKPFRSFSFLLGLLGIFGVLRNRNPWLTSPAPVTTYEPRLWKGTNHVCPRARATPETKHEASTSLLHGTSTNGFNWIKIKRVLYLTRLSFFIARRNFSCDRFLVAHAENQWRITRCHWNCEIQ